MRVGNLTPRRDLCDVRDTVRAYRLLMQHGVRGEVYNVCRGEAVEIGALLDMLRSEVAAPVDVDGGPGEAAPGRHAACSSATARGSRAPPAGSRRCRSRRRLRDILAEQRALVRNT